MRAIPELQVALNAYQPGGPTVAGPTGSPVLTRALKDLFNSMKNTTEPFVPIGFLTVLRQVVPQFGELAREGKNGMGGYAQQGNVVVYSGGK